MADDRDTCICGDRRDQHKDGMGACFLNGHGHGGQCACKSFRLASHAPDQSQESPVADTSDIEWTNATWNVLTGCSLASPGCTHCYAMKLAGTRLKHHKSREGLTIDTKNGPVWNGIVRFNEEWLSQPLQWKKARKIFVCAHSDLFHEQVADETLDRIFAVMALAGHHTFQLLTKRSARMLAYLTAPGWRDRVIALLETHQPSSQWNGSAHQAKHELMTKGMLPNVWMGISAEDQTRADERLPDLLAAPVAYRYVSAEPLLGPIDMRWALTRFWPDMAAGFLARGRFSPGAEKLRPIDWVIVGGESGRGARIAYEEWYRDLRDQCARAGTMFMFKQHGAWAHYQQIGAAGWEAAGSERVKLWSRANASELMFDGRTFNHKGHYIEVGKGRAGRLLDGVLHNDMPGERMAA